MISLIISFATAAFAVILGFSGFFLMVSPKDSLMERYQNLMLNWTSRPLKDEDFPRMSRFALSSRLIGLLLFSVGIAVLFLAFLPK